MNRGRTTAIVVVLFLLGFLVPVQASNVGIFGRPLGSKCGIENEELPQSGNSGGTQMCLLTANGLIWKDSTSLVANARLAKVLPRCGISRILSSKIPMFLAKLLTEVASNYYEKRRLLPIKVNAINAVKVSLDTIGLHPCSNGIGAPLGDWTGSVPIEAKAAWLLAVTHKKNSFGNFHFIYIAQVGSKYEVVGEGTGP